MNSWERATNVNPSQKKQILTARFEDVVLHTSNFLSVSVFVRLVLACLISTLAESTHGQPLLLKTEAFDAKLGFDGVSATARPSLAFSTQPTVCAATTPRTPPRQRTLLVQPLKAPA